MNLRGPQGPVDKSGIVGCQSFSSLQTSLKKCEKPWKRAAGLDLLREARHCYCCKDFEVQEVFHDQLHDHQMAA
ncbi:hypothetical protein, conserved [Eimeria necatrix]|uniref:Uncharacterized protein n=1 Tax=Eimeria necatrix TaxID=51315 RepID=U6MT39_9EIME|nr:hypothetical protein, conserved [Eimeria necatrix]CDJ67377.1 hypothetical protein, conserved [Eimeria necatrix]